MLWALVIASLTVVNLFQVYKYKDISKLKDLNKARQFVTNQMKSNMIDESIRLPNKYVVSEQGDSVMLGELLDSKKKLILRISEFQCNSCIDSTLLLLNKYSSVLQNKAIVIASIIGTRNRIVFKRVHNLNFPFYYIDEKSLQLNAEKGITPYFFMLDSSLTSDLVFVPDKTKTELTDFYLKKVISVLEQEKTEKEMALAVQ